MRRDGNGQQWSKFTFKKSYSSELQYSIYPSAMMDWTPYWTRPSLTKNKLRFRDDAIHDEIARIAPWPGATVQQGCFVDASVRAPSRLASSSSSLARRGKKCSKCSRTRKFCIRFDASVSTGTDKGHRVQVGSALFPYAPATRPTLHPPSVSFFPASRHF